MRYNFNDLDLLLRSGVSADEIAQAFTDELNSTIEKNKVDSRKRQAFEVLADAWNAVIDIWAEDHEPINGIETDDLYIDADQAEDIFNQCVELAEKTAPLFDLLDKMAEKDESSAFNDVMRSFLAKI